MYVNSTYFCTKRQAKKEIFEYIEFYYNRIRSHSYLGNLSPVKFEEKQEKEKVLQSKMVAQGLAKKCLFFSYLSSTKKINFYTQRSLSISYSSSVIELVIAVLILFCKFTSNIPLKVSSFRLCAASINSLSSNNIFFKSIIVFLS